MTTLDPIAEPELTLQDLLSMLRRRIGLILAIAIPVFLVMFLASMLAKRRYEATATIEVESAGTRGVDVDTLLGNPRGTSDAFSSDQEVQTQVAILQSNALALRAIHKLRLEDTPEYQLPPSDHPPSKAELANSPGYQAHLLGTFHKYLSIKPVPSSHLISISYLDPDPRLAATVANGVVDELSAEALETRNNSTEVTSQALSKQLADLRVHSEELQEKVVRMQHESGIYSLGTTDAQGRQQAYSAIMEQFQRASGTLSTAEENRILKQGIAQAAQAGNPEALTSLAGNAAVTSTVTSALGPLQSLRSQQATLQAQLDQLRTKFGPGYPRVAELQANLGAIESAIKQETRRIAERAASDYALANRNYEDAKRSYDALKSQADTLNDKMITYMIARQESDETRTLYEDLLRRLKEAGILQGLKSSTIIMIDPALVPPAPRKPNKPLYRLAGALGGLFLGVAAALLLGLLRDPIQSANDLLFLGLAPVGVLPGKRDRTSGRRDPGKDPSYDDAVRGLRSALLRTGDTPARVILLAAATPQEDTGTLPFDLAASFAGQGRRALLLDANLRHPSAVPGAARDQGLSTLLSTGGAESAAIVSQGQYLSVLPAGPAAQHPADLLDTDRMRGLLLRLQSVFDVIVVSGPPAIPSPEAGVLAEMTEVTVLLAQLGVTAKPDLRQAYHRLRSFSKRDVLIMLNGATRPHPFAKFYESRFGQRRAA